MTKHVILALLLITLTIASFGTFSGRLYAVEQISTTAGTNDDECNKIYNCKIKTENVINHPNGLNPFDKSEKIAKTTTANVDVDDAKKIQEQSCQKLMQVDIEQTKDQKIGQKLPNYLICLP